ncbi:hypothetical protein JZ751_007361 [Albula glossodonta]|uniref:Uncharacterized protein n=1 Tax=Albula glossodonta TaxID=121402 RepID=A0A8T2N3K9_9TELE|nr:hypothetical protein JZ751_007361 [Albula glossodonta]
MEGVDLLNVNIAEDETSYYLDKTWVQCESLTCLKWRLVPRRNGSGFDPSQPWYCHMNPNPLFSHCSVPQCPFPKISQLKEHGLKVVYSQLPVGSLVMVKAGKWPWWPAVLSPDPVSVQYVQQDSDGDVVRYHVEFLGHPRSRFWASAKNVQLYQAVTAEPKSLKGSLKKSYTVALEEATEMQNITCEERLRLCLFKPQECMSVTCRHCTACCSSARECEWTGEDRVMEVGNMLIINGIIFRSGRTLEEMMKEAGDPVMQQRS